MIGLVVIMIDALDWSGLIPKLLGGCQCNCAQAAVLSCLHQSMDRTVCLWDVVAETTVGSALEGHADTINQIAFSPDGMLAFGSQDKTMQLCNIETGTAIGSAFKGEKASITFSPDGKQASFWIR